MIIVICVFIAAITIIAAIILIVHYNDKITDEISFKESMDLTELPVITFTCNNRKLNFLLDTGSNSSYINKHALKGLKYKESKEICDYFGCDGNKVEVRQCVLTINYKSKSYEETFNIANLSKSFNTIKAESGVQIHGILGSKFFEKYRYVLDFSKLIAYTRK